MSPTEAPTLEPPVEPVEQSGFRDLDPNGVLEQPFWERYNDRLEMPISTAFAVLVFSLSVLFLVLAMREGRPSKNPVPLSFLGGDDDSGDGSPGDGGQELAVGAPASAAELSKLTNNVPLSEVKDNLREKLDLGGDIDISDNEAAALSQLNSDLQKKLLGARSGSGNGTTGGEAAGGKGPGGFGASSTYARALRWVLKFETSNGQDYVNQMSGIGGVIMVPVPPDGKTMVLFTDPKNPQPKTATDADIEKYTKLIQFAEANQDNVKAVGVALKLTFVPRSFFAYFPRELEEKLSSLEKNYQNKPAEQIRKTVFKVIMRGGKYDFVVTDQQLR
jgi:hypothetical protein